VLAAWTASLLRPLTDRLEQRMRGRRQAAAVVVSLVAVAIALPVILVAVGVVVGARDLLTTLIESPSAAGVLEEIATGTGAGSGFAMPRNVGDVMTLVQQYGSEAFGVLTQLAGAAAQALIMLVVYFAGTFAFVRDGRMQWQWIERHAPLQPEQLRRFAAAFDETGRGLLIGVGLTCAAQGLVAMLAYFALGVPQAWVLGPITGIAAIVPVIGVAVIWAPIAVGLALSGHPIKAVILAVIGLGIVGTIDNLLRPVFSRFGALEMPVLVLFVSAFGGLLVLGAWGALLGPLAVRLTVEALRMERADDGREA
jgi:predicted PurR-regulated permease PerM